MGKFVCCFAQAPEGISARNRDSPTLKDGTGWFSGGFGRRIVLELSGDAFEMTGEPTKLEVDGAILGFE